MFEFTGDFNAVYPKDPQEKHIHDKVYCANTLQFVLHLANCQLLSGFVEDI